MSFGVVVVGAPGAGKSTFCHGMQQLLVSLDRSPILINLDPANDTMCYSVDIDVCTLIDYKDVMETQGLGPNAALIHCMEILEQKSDWLIEECEKYPNSFFVFDLPGQVELTSCGHDSLKNLIRKLTQTHNFRLVAANLYDASSVSDPSKYVSVVLLALRSMMQLEIAQINILSKLDLIESFGSLACPLEYYLDCDDLGRLLSNSPVLGKLAALNDAISELVEDSGMVSFVPLVVEDVECMIFVLQELDKANGFAFGSLTPNNESILTTSFGCNPDRRTKLIENLTKKYIKKE